MIEAPPFAPAPVSFPRGASPACDAAGCRVRFVWLRGAGVSVEHHAPSGQVCGYFLSDAEVNDTSVLIWSEMVKPWIDRVHEEEA